MQGSPSRVSPSPSRLAGQTGRLPTTSSVNPNYKTPFMNLIELFIDATRTRIQSVPDSFKETFNFLQGNGVYEEGMMHFLKQMKNTIWTHYDAFIADAQALCAIFMLVFFAIKTYEMMAGDKQLEVMPLLRPFGLVIDRKSTRLNSSH